MKLLRIVCSNIGHLQHTNVSIFLQTNRNHIPSKKFLLDLLQWKRVLKNINNTSVVLC